MFMQWLAQHIMNALGTPAENSRWSAAHLRLALHLRRAINRVSDPTVEVVLDGFRLRMPLSHELPHYRRLFPSYSANVGRIAALLANGKGRPLRVIDVGANVGDTVAVISAKTEAIFLCVEGNPKFAALLRSNLDALDNKVRVIESFLGATTGRIEARLSEAHGTARLAPETRTDSPALPVRTLDDLVSEHPAFADPALLKIDTDGMDDEVLRGAEALLRRAGPVLFFEHDAGLLQRRGRNPEEVFGFLEGVGYSSAIFYDNFGRMIVAGALTDRDLLRDVLAYSFAPDSGKYLDVCAFVSADAPLFAAIRDGERRQSLRRD